MLELIMRYIFLSLLLISFTVQADQTFNNDECLEIYRSFLIDFNVSKTHPDAQMLYFADMCKSGDEYSDKLLMAMGTDETILALEARLVEQGLQYPVE